MQRLMREGDDGAVAVVVAVMLVALVGVGALVLDIGSLYAERRQLQNASDASALAVAQDCPTTTLCDTSTSATGLAGRYANANSNDGTSTVTEVCGVGANLSPCSPSSPAGSWDCRALPSGALSSAPYVQTRTRTLRSGSNLMAPILGQVLDPSYAGTEVRACARVSWGSPSSTQSALPVAISQCEWQNATASGTTYAPSPPYTSTGYPTSSEKILYLHNTTGASNCPAGPSGSDLPGGFGWLESSTCAAVITDGWVDDDTGVSVNNDCKGIVDDLVGTIIHLPVFVETNGLSGSNGSYRVESFAAFYLSGYALPAAQPNKVKSVATNSHLCTGSDKCLYGWFVNAPPSGGGTIGTGPSKGVTVLQMSG